MLDSKHPILQKASTMLLVGPQRPQDPTQARLFDMQQDKEWKALQRDPSYQQLERDYRAQTRAHRKKEGAPRTKHPEPGRSNPFNWPDSPPSSPKKKRKKNKIEDSHSIVIHFKG